MRHASGRAGIDVAVRAPATPSPGRKPKQRARLPPHRRRSAEPAAAARLALPPRPTDVRGLAPSPLAPMSALPPPGQPLAAGAPPGQGWPPAQAPGAPLAPVTAPAPRRSSFEELASPWAAALDAGRGVGARAGRAPAAPPGPRAAAGQHEAGPQPPRSAFASAAPGPLGAARAARLLPPASVFASAALDSFDSSDSSDGRPGPGGGGGGPGGRPGGGGGGGAAPPPPARGGALGRAAGCGRGAAAAGGDRGCAGQAGGRAGAPDAFRAEKVDQHVRPCSPGPPAARSGAVGLWSRLRPACLPATSLCGRRACNAPAAGRGTAPGGRAHVPPACPLRQLHALCSDSAVAQP